MYALSAANANEQSGLPSVLSGVIVAGSYDPIGIQQGNLALPSVEVIIGEDYASTTNTETLVTRRATLATSQIGDMAGPVGGERVVLFRSPSGWIAMFQHGPDDTPKTPQGERWIAQRNALTGEVMAFLKLTSDGATPGDGLGGFAWTGKFAGIGDEFQNLPDSAKAFVFEHIEELVGNFMSQMMQSFTDKIAAALVAASSGATTPMQQALAFEAATTVANWVVDNVTPPDIPLGSPRVKLATTL